MSEPGRELPDRHELDRAEVDRRAADLAAADPHRTAAQPGPPIGGLSTGHGLARWPSLPDDADPLGGSQIPGTLVATLRRRAGAGSPLAEDLQRAGGEALGQDLSGVRIHTDAEAGRLADSVQASAFTYGQDIYFAAGGYRPGDDAGRQLIAHELGHVGRDGAGGGVIGRADDPAEDSADRAAAGVLSALRRQARTVAAVRRSPALAPPSPGQPPVPAIRRAKKRKQPHKGGGGKRRMVAPPPPPPPPIGLVGPPAPAVPTRSYQTGGGTLAGADDYWFDDDPVRANWAPAAPAPAVVPTPRTTGLAEPDERPAGSFTVKRTWDVLPMGPGFIVQEITRTFAGLQVNHTAGWQPANPAVLRAYMGAAAYKKLHYTVDRYWEIFPVKANGDPKHNDTFELVAIADRASELAGNFDDTSKGTFTQTGTAYFVPTADSLTTFAGNFGMTLNGAAPANKLYSRAGVYDFPTQAALLYPVSHPSTITVVVTWDTDTTVPGSSEFVSLRVSEA